MTTNHDVKRRTERDAIDLIELLHARIGGWCIALGVDPTTGRMDCRTKRGKDAMALFGAIMMKSPRWRDLREAVKRGGDIVELFPEPFRDVLRFQLHHTIPLGSPPDPLSTEGQRHRVEVQGMDVWPAWLDRYVRPATVADHPPLTGIPLLKRAARNAGTARGKP